MCIDARGLRAIRSAKGWATRRARYGPSGRKPAHPEGGGQGKTSQTNVRSAGLHGLGLVSVAGTTAKVW
jgi:hypothetical protein